MTYRGHVANGSVAFDGPYCRHVVETVADSAGGDNCRGRGLARAGGGGEQEKTGRSFASPSGSFAAPTRRSASRASSGSARCPARRPPRSSCRPGWSIRRPRCGAPPTRPLLAWKDDPQVSEFLLRALNRESRAKKKGLSCVVPLVMILLASESADTQRDLTKFLDAFAASSGKRRPADRCGR